MARILQQNMREFDVLGHFEKEYEYGILMHQFTEEDIMFFISGVKEQMVIYSLKPFFDKTSVLKIKFSYTSDFSNKTNIGGLVFSAKNRKDVFQWINI